MTPLARARFVGLCGVFGGALAALAAPACGLDWTVRDDPGDGPAPESRPPDGPVIEGGPDSPTDAPDALPPDADPCVALDQEVRRTKARAKECTFGVAGQCTTTVQDECECPIVVKAAGAPRNAAYADAIAALMSACGAKVQSACASCPVLPAPAGWACLVNGDAGAICVP